MKKRLVTAVLTLILTVPAGIFAQNHVSQIKAESRNNLIKLTWADSPEARGPVYIFRSARPFENYIPANIKPVIVRYGQQEYIDDTDDIENIYYFVAASDIYGRRYDTIIFRVNSTSAGLGSIQQQEAQSGEELAAALEAPPAAAVPVEGISNLRARRDGERVIITFDYNGPHRNLILYRSAQPVQRPSDLLNAAVVQSQISSPFVDFPVPGFSWYYAAIYEDEISGGNMGIKPGLNATISPVMISAAVTAEPNLRPIPLPIMTLRNTMPEGFLHPDTSGEVKLSAESENMLSSTRMPQKKPLQLKAPRVFVIDLEAPAGGEDSALFQIISDSFVKLDWESACVSLQHYLYQPRSKDVEARARFYLGQTLYYTGKYREALMEFLSIRVLHSVEANNWIEAVLAAMVY